MQRMLMIGGRDIWLATAAVVTVALILLLISVLFPGMR
jgi:hypothetical protein